MSKPGAALKEHSLLARCEIRKPFGSRRAAEGNHAITIDSGEANKHLIHLFASHALYRIAPKARDCSNRVHASGSLFRAWIGNGLWPLRKAPQEYSSKTLRAMKCCRSLKKRFMAILAVSCSRKCIDL